MLGLGKIRKVLLGILVMIVVLSVSPVLSQEPLGVPPAGIRGDDYEGPPPELVEVSVGVAAALPIVEDAVAIPSEIIHNPQGVQNEAVLAVNPADPDNILGTGNVARNRMPDGYPRDYDATVFRSHDGGQTWNEVLLPGFPAQSQDESQGNPTVAFTASGRAVFLTLSFHRHLGPYGGVYTSISDNGGVSWSTPYQLAQETYYYLDIPCVATDPASEQVAACWTGMEGWDGNYWNSWEVYCRRSSNGGTSWGSRIHLDGSKQYTTVPHPYFGQDGTWYVVAVSMDQNNNISQINFFREGGNRRTVASQSGLDHYSLGAKPSLGEDGGGALHLAWGDGVHIYRASSANKGDTWTTPEVILAGGGGKRFMKPSLFVDPLGRPVVGAYYYNGSTLQVYVGLLGGVGVVPVGPEVTPICNIWEFQCERQYMGDHSLWSSNYRARPGGEVGLTTNLNQQSEPPGYVAGLDNNIEAAEVTTVAWPGSTSFMKCPPPAPGTVTFDFPLFNEGLETGTFQVTAWSGETGCPDLVGIPTAVTTVDGRRTATVPITVVFPEEEDRVCTYSLTITGGYGSQSVTSTLKLPLSCSRVYLPIMIKNW